MTALEEELKKSKNETEKALQKYKIWLVSNDPKLPDIEFREMPDYADTDYMVLIAGKFDHFLEIKIRRHNFKTFPKTKVPLRKHGTAEHWFNAKGHKTYFLCAWLDKLGRFDLTKEPDEIKDQVARYDRGKEKDIYAFYKVSNAEIID